MANAKVTAPTRKAPVETIKMCIDMMPDLSDRLPMPLAYQSRDQVTSQPQIAFIRDKKWKPGQTLRVRFLDGDPNVQWKVQKLAHQWSEYANIKFAFGNYADAQIRISFTPGGSWSYIGTDALNLPQNQPTMNYGWLTPSSSDREFARVVLHEFGHALGCIHEHQHPEAGIPWNTAAVYSYYARTAGWSQQQTDVNIFTRYGKDITQYSQYDITSIMHYPIDKALTQNGFEVGWNTQLSETDKQFAREAYPSTTKARFNGLWNPSNENYVWLLNCSEEQLRAKTDDLWGSMRLVYMQPFVENGEVRFNCAWKPGTSAQVWWPNCSEQDFRNKTGDLWGSMRPTQAIAFVVNGQVRYSCIWNAGTHNQIWWLNCSEQEFRDKTTELWSWARPVQMQPFVVNGQVRFSCIWNAGVHNQVWWPVCTEQDFRNKTNELWSSMRPAQVYGFVTPTGRVRYSCLWNAGTYGQIWWPNCTEQNVKDKTAELWRWGRPVHVQSFVV
jgi:serralysin